MNYLNTEPPRPPSLADRQADKNESDTLVTLINSAWREQEQQIRIVESMQNNSLRTWNKQYEQAIKQVQATMKVIGQLIAQKQQKETFLKQWAEQDKTHQSWENAPRTAQMRSLAEIFKLSLMQSASLHYLSNTIYQTQQRQEQERQAALRQNRQQQQRRGLSLWWEIPSCRLGWWFLLWSLLTTPKEILAEEKTRSRLISRLITHSQAEVWVWQWLPHCSIREPFPTTQHSSHTTKHKQVTRCASAYPNFLI